MQIAPDAWSQLQNDYVRQAGELWNAALGESHAAAQAAGAHATAPAATPCPDAGWVASTCI